MRRDPRSFGRSAPYVSAATRRRKARNRLAASCLACSGVVAFLLAYAVTACPMPSNGSNVAGFAAFMLILAGFIALAMGILAAMEV